MPITESAASTRSSKRAIDPVELDPSAMRFAACWTVTGGESAVIAGGAATGTITGGAIGAGEEVTGVGDGDGVDEDGAATGGGARGALDTGPEEFEEFDKAERLCAVADEFDGLSVAGAAPALGSRTVNWSGSETGSGAAGRGTLTTTGVGTGRSGAPTVATARSA